MAGEYLIAVEGDIGKEGGASVAARVVKVAEQLRPLVHGNTVTGTFDIAERTRFTLTLMQPSRPLFDALSSHTNPQCTLPGLLGVHADQPKLPHQDLSNIAPH